MNAEEFHALDPVDAAAALNEMLEAGKSNDEILAEIGLTKADMLKQNVFFVKGKYIARAWSGYTSTKRTGNEAGDTAQGVGNSDPSKGYNGV